MHNTQYIVYCLWRKIDVILDGHHALKLELFKETVIPRGRRLLHAYTNMVTTPFSYRNNYSRKVYVVVLGRNRTLFHCVIRLHYHI